MRQTLPKADSLFVAAEVTVILCCLITVGAVIGVIPN